MGGDCNSVLFRLIVSRSHMNKMVRFKPLQPTLKEKKRYILYRTRAEVSLPGNSGHKIVRELNNILGVFDGAAAGLQHINFDAHKNKGILRVANTMTDKTRMAMLLTTQINNQELMIQPILTSGILKKVKESLEKEAM